MLNHERNRENMSAPSISLTITPEEAYIICSALQQRAKSIMDAGEKHIIDKEDAMTLHGLTWGVYCLVSDATDKAANAGSK